MKKKVALGLSGGVDSAVAAHLLKQQGYEVHCIYLNCFDKDIPRCRTEQDRKDALSVALHLKLPFQVLDFRKEYQASVIDYFRREYEAGRTPNPDVVCNRDIKFGLFYKWAIEEQGFDYMATGHYARLGSRPVGSRPVGKRLGEGPTGLLVYRSTDCAPTISLSRPKDHHKDQTYFLWQVPRERFAHVLFPLGDYLKSEVREIAREAKLPVSEKKDSTGICFIGEVRVEEFLKRLGVKEKEGEVVIRPVGSRPVGNRTAEDPIDLPAYRSTDYQVIGRHKGVAFYTIGQRHGFEISNKLQVTSDKQDRPPLYVIEKDVEHNRLVVGFGAETYRSRFSCGQLNRLARGTWHVARSDGNSYALRAHSGLRPSGSKTTRYEPLFVRIRHGGELIPCQLVARSAKREANFKLPATCNVLLREPQRGISAGQSAVFYSYDGTVLGGGVIR